MAFTLPRLLSFSLLLLLPASAVFAGRTDGMIALGSSIKAAVNSTQKWVSPSGEFALGFNQLGASGPFLLCIYYAKITEKTVVWYVKGGISAAAGSVLTLTSADGLVLKGPQGEKLWRSETVTGGVVGGFMTDAGNFVLVNSESEYLWESFKYPTDTILPTQVLEKGQKLYSRLTETNFSMGRFELGMQDDGNLGLYPVNLPTRFADELYWKSGTDGSEGYGSAGMKLALNQSGRLYIVTENDQTKLLNAKQPPRGNVYYKATLHFDGVFVLYYRPKTGDAWIPLWSVPDNVCTAGLAWKGSGICGYNSVCRLGENQRPICSCAKGFSPVDPKNTHGDCRLDFTPTCGEQETKRDPEEVFTFLEIHDTDWPLSDIVQLTPFTADQCRESCMRDCFCSVAIFRAGDNCWKKKLPMSNGRFNPSLNSKAFVKIRKGNVTQGCI